MYIQRWLKALFINGEDQWIERESGSPQDGVISPVLANLFMHYVFDLKRTNRNAPFERYADEAVIYSRTQAKAEEIFGKLKERLEECKLELHPMKTKIVYCKDKDKV